MSEAVLDLEVNSNRVDCLAVYGLARELHAITEAKLADPPWAEDAEAAGEGKVADYASVEVEVPSSAPSPRASSPTWRSGLRRCG